MNLCTGRKIHLISAGCLPCSFRSAIIDILHGSAADKKAAAEHCHRSRDCHSRKTGHMRERSASERSKAFLNHNRANTAPIVLPAMRVILRPPIRNLTAAGNNELSIARKIPGDRPLARLRRRLSRRLRRGLCGRLHRRLSRGRCSRFGCRSGLSLEVNLRSGRQINTILHRGIPRRFRTAVGHFCDLGTVLKCTGAKLCNRGGDGHRSEIGAIGKHTCSKCGKTGLYHRALEIGAARLPAVSALICDPMIRQGAIALDRELPFAAQFPAHTPFIRRKCADREQGKKQRHYQQNAENCFLHCSILQL